MMDLFGNPYQSLDFRDRSMVLVEHGTARAFVEQWHYSNRMPTGENHSYGLRLSDVLYAVAVVGIGVNPYQYRAIPIEGLRQEEVFEIKRLCRAEPKYLELSWFVAQVLNRVRLDFPTIRVVVAFADPEHGHHGGIYAASNFIRLGVTNAEWHLEDEHGERRHRRFAFRYAKRNGVPISEARAQLGVKRIKTAPKMRWAYPLHRKDRKAMV